MADVVRFDAYMDEALYGASGFYVRGGRPAARGGDFATSVELGSLFAQCVAAYLDRIWHELGQPDPFVVVEGGAGRGTLCQQVLRHAGDCRDALHYLLVERVDLQRDEALAAIAELDAKFRVGSPAQLDTERRAGRGGAGTGPAVIAAADLPAGPLVGVVLANELLDNLPFRLLERSETGWREVYVGHSEPGTEAPRAGECDGTREREEPRAADGHMTEVLQEAPADAAAMADALTPDAVLGARVPLQLKAAVWVRRALRLLERGRLLVFDYGVLTTAEMAARPATAWLRTYRAHRRGHDPLRNPGSADITCEVAFDQLPPGGVLATQADWLASAGIDDMTATAQSLWQRSRADPIADALAARTLLDEAAALTDPNGMGAFWAAEWRAG